MSQDTDAAEAVGSASAALASSKIDETALRTAGQRHVNLLWETTQMRIALTVIVVMMAANVFVIGVVGVVLGVYWNDLAPAALAVLVTVLAGSLGSLSSHSSLVIGFYFGRTNHQRVGGVGGDETRYGR
jgi:hypothetical protein